jgi:hypothetical protein
MNGSEFAVETWTAMLVYWAPVGFVLASIAAMAGLRRLNLECHHRVRYFTDRRLVQT